MTSRAKTSIKAALDLFLTIAFLLLMEPKATGLSLHEWGGLAIGVFFVLHKALNWDWIKSVTRDFLRPGLPSMTRARYLVDLLLLAGFTLVVVSGMAISKTIDFAWLSGASGFSPWRGIHALSSLLILAGVGVHLGLHADWIRARLVPAHPGAERSVPGPKEAANA